MTDMSSKKRAALERSFARRILEENGPATRKKTKLNARQEAIQRATAGAKRGEYDVSRDSRGVTHVSQSSAQKAQVLQNALSGLTSNQQDVLMRAIASNPRQMEKGNSGFAEDTLFYKYMEAIKGATDAEGNVHINPSQYEFNPYSGGQRDDQAWRAYKSLSVADQLNLNIDKKGKVVTPDFGDSDVDTSVYDRYQAALAKVKADDKNAEALKKGAAEIQKKQQAENAKAKAKSDGAEAVKSLYKQHRGDFAYDASADLKSIADRTGATKDDLTDLYKSYQSRYDLDDDAYERAFRYYGITNPTELARAAGVSEQALSAKERGIYKPKGKSGSKQSEIIDLTKEEYTPHFGTSRPTMEDARASDKAMKDKRSKTTHDPSRNTMMADTGLATSRENSGLFVDENATQGAMPHDPSKNTMMADSGLATDRQQRAAKQANAYGGAGVMMGGQQRGATPEQMQAAEAKKRQERAATSGSDYEAQLKEAKESGFSDEALQYVGKVPLDIIQEADERKAKDDRFYANDPRGDFFKGVERVASGHGVDGNLDSYIQDVKQERAREALGTPDVAKDVRYILATTMYEGNKPISNFARSIAGVETAVLTACDELYGLISGGNDNPNVSFTDLSKSMTALRSQFVGLDTLMGIAEGIEPNNPDKMLDYDGTPLSEGVSDAGRWIAGMMGSVANNISNGGIAAGLGTAVSGATYGLTAGNVTLDVGNAVAKAGAPAWLANAASVLNLSVGVNSLPFALDSAQNAYLSAKEEKYSEGRSAAYGITHGIVDGLIGGSNTEALFTMLGSPVSSLLKSGVGTELGNVAIKTGLDKVFAKYGTDILSLFLSQWSESTEEVIQLGTDRLIDKWVLGKDVEPITAGEVFSSIFGASTAVLLLRVLGLGYARFDDAMNGRKAQQLSGEAATIIDNKIQNGVEPSIEDVTRLAEEANNIQASQPAPMSDINNLVEKGVNIDAKVKQKYQAACDDLDAATKRVSQAQANLTSIMNSGAAFNDPARMKAVEEYTEAVKERNAAEATRKESYQGVLANVEEIGKQGNEYYQNAVSQAQQLNEQYNKAQFQQRLESDPTTMFDILTQQEAVINERIAQLQQQASLSPSAREYNSLNQQIAQCKQQLETVQGYQQQALDYASSQEYANIQAIPATIQRLQETRAKTKSKAKVEKIDATIAELQRVYNEAAPQNTQGSNIVDWGTVPSEKPVRWTDPNAQLESQSPQAEIQPEVQNVETAPNVDTAPQEAPETTIQPAESAETQQPPQEVPQQKSASTEPVTSNHGNVDTDRTMSDRQINQNAQEMIDSYRSQGASAEQLKSIADSLKADEDADARAIGQKMTDILNQEQGNFSDADSLAKKVLSDNASTYNQGKIADRFARARQELVNGNTDAANRIGEEAARAILLSGPGVTTDTYNAEIKSYLRQQNIAPNATERANIAATYDSYDAYRRSVMGIVNLKSENARGAIDIDHAVGELAQQYNLGNIDDKVQWLHDFATSHPSGEFEGITYDGDIDADSKQLWNEIKDGNPQFFNSESKAAISGTPDFNDKTTSVSKQSAAAWLKERKAAGDNVSEIMGYARDKANTALTGRERRFWRNVVEADGKASGKAKTSDFRATQSEQTLRDSAHLWDLTSVYANDIDMRYEPATETTPRKLSSIRRDIQNILEFNYSDENFRRAPRRRGAVAYYEPRHVFVQSSDPNSMTAFLHEAGHHVDLSNFSDSDVAAFMETMPQAFLNNYQGEDIKMGEAAAEMFRAWMLNPKQMEANYPTTFEGLREQLGDKKYNRLKNQSNAVRYFMGSDTQGRVEAVMVDSREKARDPIGRKLKELVIKNVDSNLGLKEIDRKMNRAGIELDEGGLDARAAQARTSREAVNTLLFDGMYDTHTGEKITCGFGDTCKGIITTKADMDTLNVYLELKQAMDRYDANHNDWVFSRDVCTPAEARAYIENVENGNANVVQAANNIWSWLKSYRDTQLSNTFSQETKQAWEQRNPHYIPQTREFDSDIRSATHGGGIRTGSGINHRREGSTRNIVTLIEAITNMVYKTKTAAMNHDVMNALVDYYDHDADGIMAGYLHEIDPRAEVTDVDADTMRRAAVDALRQAGYDEATLDNIGQSLETYMNDGQVVQYTAPNGRVGNAFAITQDGRTRYFEVYDQDVLSALTTMSKPQVEGVLKGVRKVTGMVNSLITSKNPAFATSNALRDIQEAYLTGSEQRPVQFMRDYLAAAADVFGNKDIVNQYKAMGGSGGLASMYADKKTLNDVNTALFGSVGDNRNAMQRVGAAINNFIENSNEKIELIPRLAEYKRQLARGASYADAIKAAKNVTTDFSAGGTSNSADKALWRFFNASIQSSYKAANTFIDGSTNAQSKSRLGKQIAAFGGVVAARAIIDVLLRITDDDGTYDAIPDYIKNSYWIIPTPTKGKYIRIPTANGLYTSTANAIGLRIGEAVTGIREGGEVGNVIGEQAVGLIGDILDAINPFGEFNEGNPIGSNFNLNPLIQVVGNKSWTGAPIVPKSMENLSPELQYDDNTSEFAKLAGKIMGFSPLKLDYLINQNSGTIGEVKDALDAGIKKGQTDGVAAGTGEAFSEYFLSRFKVDTAYSQQVTSAFYDYKEQLNTLVEDVDTSENRNGTPYTPQFKNLTPYQAKQAQAEAKTILTKMNTLAKQLKQINNLASEAQQAGDEEKARELKFKAQEIALKANLYCADYYEKWKKVGKKNR